MKKNKLAAFLSCSGQELTAAEAHLFNQYSPAGITLFARNISTRQQLSHLIEQIKDASGEDTLIAVDQEGGRVRRLKEPEFRSYTSAQTIGNLTSAEAIKTAKLHAELISNDLKSVGFDINFAPVLDVLHSDTTAALGSRCFSSDYKKVAKLGKVSVDTYIKRGIIPCIKHLPGHGLATNDPHLGLPIIDADLTTLQTEFYPFIQCNYAPMGMTAHIILSAIDKQHPLTQSSIGIHKVIREIIGFNGFLISDAIDMNALSGTIPERAVTSLQAGCDCVCYCMGNIDEMTALTRVCPNLSAVAAIRLDKARQILHNNTMRGITSKEERYKSLIGNITAYQEKYDATEVLHQMQRTKKC